MCILGCISKITAIRGREITLPPYMVTHQDCYVQCRAPLHEKDPDWLQIDQLRLERCLGPGAHSVPAETEKAHGFSDCLFEISLF